MLNYVVICVSQNNFAKGFLQDLSEALARLKLKAGQLTENEHGPWRVWQLKAQAADTVSPERIKTILTALTEGHRVDILCVEESLFKTPKKLIAFDMDSTIIQAEVIDEMAAHYGVGEQVKLVTQRAMNGEMDFNQSLAARLSLLKGLQRDKLEEIYRSIKLTPGTETLLRLAHKQGIKTAIVSGGFSFFAEKFRRDLGMTYAFANELAFAGEALTGEVRGEVLNAQKKVDIVQQLCRQENLTMAEVAAVGDGANDLPMLAAVGIGVAIHGKERVRAQARHLIDHNSMTALAFYLGIPYGDV